MKHKRISAAGIALTLAFLLIGVAVVYAQTGGSYDLTWSTVDGGGYTFSIGGAYTLGGTVGQPDTAFMQGGAYTLSGGFWPGGAAEEYKIYLPLILK